MDNNFRLLNLALAHDKIIVEGGSIGKLSPFILTDTMDARVKDKTTNYSAGVKEDDDNDITRGKIVHISFNRKSDEGAFKAVELEDAD
ncbi:uncharacterized protein PHALS_04421 [Plasmopara halstedii]|uniref:Uncharacterized protein n=1 Tax=Plasmopara halstedii TaxID=4781 RepID=A0A0P1B2C5_PLAHL|nr:uncharacterized protein PHALS_04421 [Plasmopara halstedii]CEG47553.1 hypothetical protein PHALS_04421 [Plasmopara halstedii]|eukprot:XP_024583922.1 hypothetical protein PHALS_04421 [Plasmopara halstedii]